MDRDEMLAQLLKEQADLGSLVLRLFQVRRVRHELQLSTLLSLIEFLVPLYPCCAERSSTALLNLGIRFAEQVREQESAVQLH